MYVPGDGKRIQWGTELGNTDRLAYVSIDFDASAIRAFCSPTKIELCGHMEAFS